MSEIMTILALAVTVEALVEYGKSVGGILTAADRKQALTRLAAAVAGVILCLAAGADLYAAAGLAFGWPWLGAALTGVLISRGANYVSDFMRKLQGSGAVS